MRKLFLILTLVACLLTALSGTAFAQDRTPPKDYGGLAPVDPSMKVDQPTTVKPALVLTRDMITRAEQMGKQRMGSTGEQVVLRNQIMADTWGPTTYWFSTSWTDNDARMDGYSSWNFFKISGSSTLFYVEEVGSAYTVNCSYWLTRFEPWIMSGTSAARLISWDPSGQVVITNEALKIRFSLEYQGAGIGTEFYPLRDTYNPYPWSTHYSLEWRGSKACWNTVGNNYVTRWSGGSPTGMTMAFCGRGTYWYGNCSDR